MVHRIVGCVWHLPCLPLFRYVNYCMKRLRMLLFHNVTPIMVFDGRNLPTKADKEKERREWVTCFCTQESIVGALCNPFIEIWCRAAIAVVYHLSIMVETRGLFGHAEEHRLCSSHLVELPSRVSVQIPFRWDYSVGRWRIIWVCANSSTAGAGSVTGKLYIHAKKVE